MSKVSTIERAFTLSSPLGASLNSPRALLTRSFLVSSFARPIACTTKFRRTKMLFIVGKKEQLRYQCQREFKPRFSFRGMPCFCRLKIGQVRLVISGDDGTRSTTIVRRPLKQIPEEMPSGHIVITVTAFLAVYERLLPQPAIECFPFHRRLCTKKLSSHPD